MSRLLQQKKLRRVRIEGYLDEGIRLPLCVVEACAGFGKTTAVQQYVEQKGISSFWYSLREQEKDSDWLWKRISELLRKTGFSGAEEVAGAGFPYTREERKRFIGVLRRVLKGVFLFVLDDYHENRSDELNVLLEDIAEAGIKGLHLILITRPGARFCYDTLILHGKCLLIDQKMLSFTGNEIREYLELNDCRYPDTDIRHIEKETEGWISAICLTGVRAYDGIICNVSDITRLMKRCVFDELEEDTKDVLMKLAVLDNFTYEEAQFVLDLPKEGSVLGRSLSKIGFLEYDLRSCTFHIHSLLRKVAVDELLAGGGSAEDIWNRCGAWYEKQGKSVYAVQYYEKSHNYNKIYEIMDREGRDIYRIAPQVFHDLLEERPVEEKALHFMPYLLFLYEWYLKGHTGESLQKLKQLQEYFLQGQNMLSWEHGEYNVPAELMLLEGMMNIGNLEYAVQPLLGSEEIFAGSASRIFDSSTYQWYAKGKQAYQRGDILKAEQTLQVVMERAVSRQIYQVYIPAVNVLLQCFAYQGAAGMLKNVIEQFYETLDPELLGPVETELYQLTVKRIARLSGSIREPGDWTERTGEQIRNTVFQDFAVSRIMQAVFLCRQEKYVELISLAEDMAHASNHSLAVWGKLYRTIAGRKIFGEEQAGQELEDALLLAEQEELVAPFMENAGEILDLLEELKYKGSRTFYRHVMKHCRTYQKGLLAVNSGRKERKGELTERELEILLLVRSGYKNSEIGERIHIANVTVEKALSSIYRKLGVSNRAQAVRKLDEILK